MARQGAAQRDGKGGGEAPGRRVGASAKQNAAGQALHGAGDRLCTAAPGKTGEGAGGGRKGLFCNFQNF